MTKDTAIAFGGETISSGTLTIDLYSDEMTMTPWIGSGNYYVLFGFEGVQEFYISKESIDFSANPHPTLHYPGDFDSFDMGRHDYGFTHTGDSLIINIFDRSVPDTFNLQPSGGEFPIGTWVNQSDNSEKLVFTATTMTRYSQWFTTCQLDYRISGSILTLSHPVFIPSLEQEEVINNWNANPAMAEANFRSTRLWIPATSTIGPPTISDRNDINYHINDQEPETYSPSDSYMTGTWQVVNYWDDPDTFNGETGTNLFWTSVIFQNGTAQEIFGAGSVNGKWTSNNDTTHTGIVFKHSGDGKAAEEYLVRNVDGTAYLFIQWKSGDYSARGMKPRYYVFTKQ
jgi:hypothetical protein